MPAPPLPAPSPCSFDARGYSPKCGPTYCDLTFTNNGAVLRVSLAVCRSPIWSFFACLHACRDALLLAFCACCARPPPPAQLLRLCCMPADAKQTCMSFGPHTMHFPALRCLLPSARLTNAPPCLPLAFFCFVCPVQGYDYKGAYQYKPTNLTDFMLVSA